MHFFFHHITLPSPDNDSRTWLNEPSVNSLHGAFAESLLIGTQTTVLLAFGSVPKLIEWLGLGLLEELLQEKVIQFAFAEALSTAYITNENIRALNMNVPPGLAAVFGKSQNHATVRGRAFQEISEEPKLPRPERRRIARLVEKHCQTIGKNVNEAAYDAARADVAGAIGEELAFPSGIDPDSGDLPEPFLRRYLNVAGANVNVQMAAALQCDNLIADRITARVLRARVSDALAAVSLSAADYRSVLQIEQVPDLGRLIDENRISFRRIVELSRTREAEEFRKWLTSVEPVDSFSAVREYQREVLKHALDSTPLKTFKVVAYTGVGAALSLVDPTGVVSGFALNSFDAFILSALKRRWKPKLFIDRLKELDA